MDEYKSRLSAYLTDMIREELEKYDGGYTDEWNDQRKKNAEVLGYELEGTSDIKEELQNSQGEQTDFKKGDLVKDINPDCPHHGSEGEVTKVGKGTITFDVSNNGKNYQQGDELEKTVDQMVKLKESVNEGFTKYHIRLTNTPGWYGVWDKKGKQKFEGDKRFVTKHLKKLKTRMGNYQLKSLIDVATKRKGKDIEFDVVESVNESGILYKAGVKKYGKEGMRKIQRAAGKRKSHAEIGAIKDKYEKDKKESVDEARLVGYDKSYLKNAKKRLKVPHEITKIEYKRTPLRSGVQDKFVRIWFKLKWKPGRWFDPEEHWVSVFYDSPERLKMIGKKLKLKLKESVNEANVIQKIDKLAKRNKYGTVDGTRMNGKTAKEIMAIFKHPKMNSYRRQMMGMKSHELADLTVTLVKPLKIKVESAMKL